MDIEEQVIDIDGSCRDVNFPDIDRPEAIALVSQAQTNCELKNATDSEGTGISVTEIIARLSSSEAETIVSYWTCQGLISHVQLFFSWGKGSKVFVELTFFPQDVDKKAYSLKEFLKWLKPFLVLLNTSTYFVRYENASWKYGDTSEDSGVIFTNAQYAING
jgi:hypothetical protein